MSWSQLLRNEPQDGHRVAIAPSLLSADFSRLEEEIRAVESAGADLLHLDVMDAHFVPNLTFGPFIVSAIRKLTELTLDTHLMIEHPDRYIERFAEAGSDIITVHVEASTDLRRDLRAIRELGKKSGVTLNPDTPIDRVEDALDDTDLFLVMSVFPGFGGQSFIADVLGKVERARDVRADRNLDFAIEIDGGIAPDNAHRACDAGADILVAGTSVFRTDDYRTAIDALRGNG